MPISMDFTANMERGKKELLNLLNMVKFTEFQVILKTITMMETVPMCILILYIMFVHYVLQVRFIIKLKPNFWCLKNMKYIA